MTEEKGAEEKDGGAEKESPAKSVGPKDEPQDAAAVTDDEKKEDDNGAGEKAGEKKERKERKFREPKVVNSRAAMLGEVNAPKPEVSPRY